MLMETRFPISRDKEHVNISFTWYDAFKNTKRTEQFSIHFEKAAVLFNIGAILSQQALQCDRTSDQGVKDAAKKFQVPFFGHDLEDRFLQTLWHPAEIRNSLEFSKITFSGTPFTPTGAVLATEFSCSRVYPQK